jgi:hypothetical protein
MSQIDAARLSRVLASLTKPKERADSTADAHISATALAKNKAIKLRDPEVLKHRLKERLKSLQSSTEEFSEIAPIVAVQEILRWEFGEDIFQHPEFERIAGQVTATLMSDKELKKSITKTINNLSKLGD